MQVRLGQLGRDKVQRLRKKKHEVETELRINYLQSDLKVRINKNKLMKDK